MSLAHSVLAVEISARICAYSPSRSVFRCEVSLSSYQGTVTWLSSTNGTKSKVATKKSPKPASFASEASTCTPFTTDSRNAVARPSKSISRALIPSSAAA
jgi:hypothetical protein